MTTRMSSAALTGRMLRRRPGPGLVVAMLSIVLAAVVAVVPVVLSVLSDRIAQEAAASLSPGQRDLVATATGTIATGPAPDGVDVGLPAEAADMWGAFDARLERARDGIAAPLRALVGPAQYAVRTGSAPLEGRKGTDSLGLILDPRYRDHAVLTEGAWPEPFAFGGGNGAPPESPARVEIALSTDSARWLEWKVGDERTSTAWQSYGVPRMPVVLVGVFEPAPGSDGYWLHLDSVLKPAVVYRDGEPYPTATGFVAPESLPGVPSANQVQAWYPVSSAGIAAADLAQITAQLRAFAATPVPVGEGTSNDLITRLSFDSGAIPTLQHALDTQSAMIAVFAITAAGPAGAAIAVLAVACRVIARSRRPALALLSARGASRERLRVLQMWHGFWFGSVPALVAGLLLFAAAVAARLPLSWASVAGILIVAALPPAILGAMPPPGPHLQEEVSGEPTRAQHRRRLAIEIVVAVLAALAAAALISGALAGDRVGSSDSATSVLVILAPLLAAFAGCVLALRLFPLPLRALLARERRGRRLTGFLGAARALRESAAGVAPVLALLIGVSSATMSGVLLGSIQHEIDESSRTAVGADIQIGRADLSDQAIAGIAGVPGVAGVAPIGSVTRITIRGEGADHVTATVLTVDPDEVAAVQDPAAPLVPAGGDLTTAGALPIVLSALTSSQLSGAGEVTVGRTSSTVAGVSALAAPPGITDVWAVIDRARVSDITRADPAVRNALVRLAPGADAAAVAGALRDVVGADATILTAATVRDELSQRTGTQAIRVALIAASAAAALFAALAVMLTLVLGAPARDRLLGLLRALGAPSRVGRGLAWWELWPPLLASVVVGLAVGLTVPALLLVTVDFGVFIDADPAYHLDPLLLGGAVAGFLVLTAALTVAALGLSRRVRTTAVLRQSQEG